MKGMEKNMDNLKFLFLRVKRKLVFSVVVGVILCLSVGFLAGQATQTSVNSWYLNLKKPFLTPPNWLFAPVWTLLYLLMGIAIGRIFCSGMQERKNRTAIYYFVFQLFINGLWSLIFFGVKSPIGAMMVILILLFLIVKTIQQFKGLDLMSARLLYPYLIWVGFASYLNLGIVLLNYGNK